MATPGLENTKEATKIGNREVVPLAIIHQENEYLVISCLSKLNMTRRLSSVASGLVVQNRIEVIRLVLSQLYQLSSCTLHYYRDFGKEVKDTMRTEFGESIVYLFTLNKNEGFQRYKGRISRYIVTLFGPLQYSEYI